VGDLAPNFTLQEFGMPNSCSLTDFAGKIVVLDFFAYWCGPCKTASSELEPYIQQYYAAQGGNPAKVPVQLVSMNIDGSNPVETLTYINTYHLEKVLEDTSQTAFSTYTQGGIPQFVIINGLANAKMGSKTLKQWEILQLQTGYGSGLYTSFRNTINQVTPVPEPTTLTLLGMGVAALVFGSRRWLKNRLF
jgi:thiol-disulfide isomerase/thioredoxin